MKKQREEQILEILEEQGQIHYFQLAIKLGVGSETARRSAVMISLKYPNNIEYLKGTLRLIKSLMFDDLPVERRLEALKKTLRTKQKIEQKLKRNHLPHLIKATEEANFEKIKIQVERLKELFGVE